MGINVALDGPSGAGKSTIAKKAAAALRFVYVDTGALYRSIAYYMISQGIAADDSEKVIGALPGIDVRLEYREGSQHVVVNGEDVSDKIRTPEISMGASKVSAIPEVRTFLFDLQRDIAAKNDIIMDGRDIGTVVLPKAQVKIFLTASAEERANRRFRELQEKGDPSTYEEVLADINQRDYNDTHRETAPLKKAEDAVEVDSTSLTLDEAVERVIAVIKEKTGTKGEPPAAGAKKERKPLLDFSGIEPVKRGKKLNPVRMFFYNILRYLVIGGFKIAYNLKFEGKENVPKDGSNIFASNHRGYVDPVFISLACRVPNTFMAKEELFHGKKFFVWIIKKFGAFPVERGKGDMQAINTSFEKLNSGRNLVIFPEGTRSKDGKVGRGKTGVALIAAVAQCPVIPVGINYEGEKLKFRKKVVIRFGKPISPEQLRITTPGPKELKLLRTTIMDSIVELVH
ncbi:MAG: (d)CMP kinase [Ruminococcus sp.]|nr:(d)CMP kinase [Ruminococcus sp.]